MSSSYSFTELDTFLDSQEADFGLTPHARQLIARIPGDEEEAYKYFVNVLLPPPEYSSGCGGGGNDNNSNSNSNNNNNNNNSSHHHAAARSYRAMNILKQDLSNRPSYSMMPSVLIKNSTQAGLLAKELLLGLASVSNNNNNNSSNKNKNNKYSTFHIRELLDALLEAFPEKVMGAAASGGKQGVQDHLRPLLWSDQTLSILTHLVCYGCTGRKGIASSEKSAQHAAMYQQNNNQSKITLGQRRKFVKAMADFQLMDQLAHCLTATISINTNTNTSTNTNSILISSSSSSNSSSSSSSSNEKATTTTTKNNNATATTTTTATTTATTTTTTADDDAGEEVCETILTVLEVVGYPPEDPPQQTNQQTAAAQAQAAVNNNNNNKKNNKNKNNYNYKEEMVGEDILLSPLATPEWWTQMLEALQRPDCTYGQREAIARTCTQSFLLATGNSSRICKSLPPATDATEQTFENIAQEEKEETMMKMKNRLIEWGLTDKMHATLIGLLPLLIQVLQLPSQNILDHQATTSTEKEEKDAPVIRHPGRYQTVPLGSWRLNLLSLLKEILTYRGKVDTSSDYSADPHRHPVTATATTSTTATATATATAVQAMDAVMALAIPAELQKTKTGKDGGGETRNSDKDNSDRIIAAAPIYNPWPALCSFVWAYPNNDFYHRIFFQMLRAVVLEHHEATLRLVLQKSKFLTRAVRSLHSGGPLQGILMQCLNLVHLRSQSLPSSAFLAQYLASHDGWKGNIDRLTELTINQQKPIKGEEGAALTLNLGSAYAAKLGLADVSEWDATSVTASETLSDSGAVAVVVNVNVNVNGEEKTNTGKPSNNNKKKKKKKKKK